MSELTETTSRIARIKLSRVGNCLGNMKAEASWIGKDSDHSLCCYKMSQEERCVSMAMAMKVLIWQLTITNERDY